MYGNKTTMKVTSEPITIDDKELKDCIFNVPLYQREYSWDLEQISDLFNDINDSYEDNEHFLGSILLFARDGINRDIIDGQQRLTTIFLILWSIRKALDKLNDGSDNRAEPGLKIIDNILYKRIRKASIIDNSNEPRLTTGKRDKNLFRAILRGENIDGKGVKDGRKKSHRLLINATLFIDTKVEQVVKSDGITGLLELLDKVTACRYIVMTAEKQEDQKLLFKTLNSRGVELSESDLIKNEICINLKGGTTDEEVIQLWDETRDLLEQKNNTANIDIFLFHFINSLADSQDIRQTIEISISKNRISENYPPIPEKMIFSGYAEKIKRISRTSDFLEEIKINALSYLEIYSPDEKDKSYTYLNSLRAMNITKCYPLLLRGKRVLNDKNFELLAKAVECISFRHSVLKNDPKELERFYYNLLSKLQSDKDIDVVIDDIRQHPSVKIEENFKRNFILSSPKSNVAKMILSRIIQLDSEAINWQSKDIHLEHIMPQTVKGEWISLKESSEELYDMSVNRLGNLTLLKGKINISVSNNDFSEKKKQYENSRLNINHDIIKAKNWDFDTIDNRQTNLYELAKNIWKI
jgi:uncharacterized protein with ParB-like and HNH nuclease domain